MFIENSSLHYIEADAQDVVAMYRSTSTIKLGPGGRLKQPCEAFICVTNDGTDMSVYVALALMQSKSFIIFVPRKQPHDKKACDLLVSEANDFVKEYGFEMQSVNLNYSKALKEVVLNDLRVVRSAALSKKTSQRKSSAEKAPKKQQDSPETTGSVDEKLSAQINNAAQESSQSAPEKESEKTTARVAMEPDDQALQPLSEECPGLAEEMQRKNLLTADMTTAKQVAAQTLASLRDENDKLEKELLSSQQQHKTEIASAKAQLEELSRQKAAAEATVEKELAKLNKESQRLSGQIASQQKTSEQNLSALAREIDELTMAKQAVEEETARECAAVQAELASLTEDKSKQELAAAEKISALRTELEQLSAAKTTVEKEQAREIAVLKAELEGLSVPVDTGEELAALRKEIERCRTEKADTESNMYAERSGLQQQVAALEEELQSLRLQGEEERAILSAELDNRTLENERVRQELEQDLVSLRSQIEQLVGEISGIREMADAERATLAAERKRLIKEKSAAELNRLMRSFPTFRNEIAHIEDEIEAADEAHAATVTELHREMARLTEEQMRLRQSIADERGGVA